MHHDEWDHPHQRCQRGPYKKLLEGAGWQYHEPSDQKLSAEMLNKSL